jgi:hypothetical protein
MRKDMFKGVVLGAIVSTVILFAATAMAGTGIGGVFNLGKTNNVNAQSTLKGSTGKRNLQLSNTGAGAALGISVGAGKHPIVVNAAAGKATNLDADELDGKGAKDFVQGGGLSVSGRSTLNLGGGGFQHVATVPGWGEVVGGCGSGGGGVGFLNGSGHDLVVFPFAGSDLTPVTFGNGTSSGLFPPGVGSAGTTIMQIGSTDFSDQHILTVIATRSATVSNQCTVQAWAVTL